MPMNLMPLIMCLRVGGRGENVAGMTVNVRDRRAAFKAGLRCYGNGCYTDRMTPRATATEAVAVDAYLFDSLMPDLVGHDRSSSGFIVYLHLWRRSAGSGEPSVQISLRDIAERTGLSKRGVQQALSTLAKRQLISISRR